VDLYALTFCGFVVTIAVVWYVGYRVAKVVLGLGQGINNQFDELGKKIDELRKQK
jgi:hypothetical protein